MPPRDDAPPRTRLYVEGDLAAGAAVPLTPEQVHQLRNVLRLGPGAALLLFNGRDGEWRARLDELGRSRGAAVVEAQTRPQQASPDLWLVFSPLKRHRLVFLVEKATELGAAVLQPVLTRRTDAPPVNPEKLRATAVEAAEQCERLEVPAIREAVRLDALLAVWPADRPLLVCAEAGPARPLAEVVAWLAGRPAAVLVGPEGGFARSELDGLAKLPNVSAVGLGPRILRAETAALAALACWQALAGDGRDRPPGRAA